MKQQRTVYFSKQCILGNMLLIAGSILLAGVFVKDSIINPGLQINQYVYYNTYIPLFALCVLLSVLVNRKNYPLNKLFYKKEVLVFIFAVIVAVTYRWQLNPASERLYFLFQLCSLWYLLRIATYHYPFLSVAWSVVLMLMGSAQAVIGLMQLYGWEYSNHALFSMTGSFFNPGPYSGFLALTFPIAIFFILRYRHYKHVSWVYKGVRWCAWLCAVLVFVALPATMGRTAWAAAIISSLWVLWREMGWLLKPCWRKHKTKLIVLGIFLIAGLTVLSIYSYQLKSASANGRLFLWEMDFKAWINNLEGTGLGRFSVAYGEAQADYFGNGYYSGVEESVAGTPSYAFNEYLQLLVEHSFLGMIIVLIMGWLVFYCGYWNKQTGWVGVLIALCIFSFASYPLQLPVFMIILVFASTGCMSWKRNKEFYEEDYSRYNRLKTILLVLFLVIAESAITYRQWDMEKPYREWEKSRILYQVKAYENIIAPYDKLFPVLGAQPDFLFEYGHALSKLGRYSESNRILKKGTMVSADPMFWNVMGKNYQAMGNLGSAEQCFLHSTRILPGRIYPYYLLTKLYANPDIDRKDRMLQYGKIVLEKEPKVQSTAVRQMRNEVRQLLKNK